MALMGFNLDLVAADPHTCRCLRQRLEPQARLVGGQAELSLSQALQSLSQALQSLWELFGSFLSIECLWQGSWQEEALQKQRHAERPAR